jgi:hypothetical protein
MYHRKKLIFNFFLSKNLIFIDIIKRHKLYTVIPFISFPNSEFNEIYVMLLIQTDTCNP